MLRYSRFLEYLAMSCKFWLETSIQSIARRTKFYENIIIYFIEYSFMSLHPLTFKVINQELSGSYDCINWFMALQLNGLFIIETSFRERHWLKEEIIWLKSFYHYQIYAFHKTQVYAGKAFFVLSEKSYDTRGSKIFAS